MNARLTMFLRVFVIGCCVVAFTAVAQTDPQQRTDEHHDNGQQRPAEQNAGHNGVNRPQQQQGAQAYRGEHPPEQGQQHQTQQQSGQNSGQPQQYHPQQQQRGQSNSAQQQNGHYRPQQQQSGQQQYQQHGNQQYEQRGDQQHRADSNRSGQQYRSNNRPEQWGHAPARRPTFNFRSNDRGILQRYYAGRLHGIDRAHRPVFRIGGYLPYEDLGFFAPVPPGAWGSLPPIPYGYAAGYWDGYVVVYDPNTGYILYVTDLL